MKRLPASCWSWAGLLLALAAGLAGCVAAGKRGPAPGVVARAAEFTTALHDARGEGRREVEDILEVYAQLPAELAPGVKALRGDVRDAYARATAAGRTRLTPAEVDQLTLRNPHFWHAWFEFHPRDCSLLMLHASLLMEAGELFRASLVLTCGVQAAPLNPQERMFWFVQQARTHWTIARRLAELEAQQRAWGTVAARRAAALDNALVEWPEDGFAVEAQLRTRAGLALRDGAADDGRPLTLTVVGRQAAAADLERLRHLSPVAAARYAEDQAAAAEFARLWDAVSDEERPAEDRTLTRLAEQARRLGFPEMAMVVRRLAVGRRGFYAPADMEPIRQLLPQLLSAADAAEVVAFFEEGTSPGVRLTKPAEEAGEVLPGMDPLVHPLYAEQAVREFGRENLWVEAAGDDRRMHAEHLRKRAIRSSNVGRFAAALADLDAALRLFPKEVPWLVERATLLAKTGRAAEAEAAFAQARGLAPRDGELQFAFAVFRMGQGRFAEAEPLFRAGATGAASRPYAVIFADLCGLRRGAPDRAWLRANRVAGTDWPAPIQRFLLGELDRKGLLAAARDPSDLRTTEQQCEAFLSLGLVALMTGEREAAERELDNCVQSGIVGFIEYDLAKRELARLRQPAPAPAPARPTSPSKKDSTPGGDDGVAVNAASRGRPSS